MAIHEPSPNVNKPVFGLLAALILGGLVWLVWPSDASETEDASGAEAGEVVEAPEEQPESKPRDLARETKAIVSGTVRSFGGPPLAGAQVCVTPVRGQLRGLGDGKPTCVRTGQDGHYRIEGLWPVRTQFSASAAAHEPKLWRTKDERGRQRDYATLMPGRETKGVDFELAAGGVKLSGVVKDLGGGEIEGALVEASSQMFRFSAAEGTTVAFSDADGRFELWVAKGQASVVASAEGYGSSWAQAFAPSERVELFLTPESVLIGQVVHADTGEPVADVMVGAGPAGPFGGSEGDQVRSDAEGRFRITELFPGSYKPIATDDHFYGQAAMQVHLGLGQTSESVEIRVHPMALIEGRVVIAGSAAGCPEGNVLLTRIDQTERSWATTDDEGNVSLRGVRPGEYQVEVDCTGQVSGDAYPNLTVASADLLGQVWEVREGQAIRGLVVDSEGKPVSEASVSARMVVDASNARAQVTSAWAGECEDDGSFELAGLLAGRYEITVRAEQPAPDAPLVVDLPAGADRNDVRIELLATGTITGRVIDEHGTPQPGANAQARPLGKRGRASAMTDDEGNFVIEHVRAGEVRVQAGVGMWGSSSMRAPGSSDDDVQGELVEVIAGQTLDVELRVESRTGVIRGRVLDEHGAPVDDAFISSERQSDSATASAGQSRSSIRWGGGSPILSDVDGSFTIDELAPGNYMVRAHRRGGGEAIAESVPVGGNVELTIASTGMLAGTVVVTGGEAPEKFRVTVSDRAQGLSFNDEFFRTGGQWQISELPAGKYEISVESNAGTTMIEVELEAGASLEDLELVLQPRVTYRGRLIDIDTREPVPGMEVSVSGRAGGFRFRGGQGERKQVSDAEGRFEVEHAPTGSVNVVVAPRSWGNSGDYEMAFFSREIATEPAVQDSGDLELIQRRLDPEQAAGDIGFELKQQEPGTEPGDVVLRVGLIRLGGPAAATELAVGDVIETVDGKSVMGVDSSRYRSLTRVAAGTVIELGLAEGKTITITAAAPIR
jgi:hypothetical protein